MDDERFVEVTDCRNVGRFNSEFVGDCSARNPNEIVPCRAID